MALTLRIVGLFFNKKVEYNPALVTVKDVMDAYINAGNANLAKPGGLAYMIEANIPKTENSLKEISFHYGGKYDIRPLTAAIEGDGTTLGGKDLSSGVRTLSELRVNDDVILAWQYYVLDRNRVNKSATRTPRGFTLFGVIPTPPNYTIEDGDTIIWRLVAINLRKQDSYYTPHA